MKMTIQDIFREVLPTGSSFSEARRQIVLAGVLFNGEQATSLTQEVEVKPGSIFQVGKNSVWRFGGQKWVWVHLVQISDDIEYQMKLADNSVEGTTQPSIQLRARRSVGDNLLMLGAEGYGEMTALDGGGFPVIVEFHEGKFRLVVWGDINQEDPTHVISLEGAREDAREPPFEP